MLYKKEKKKKYENIGNVENEGQPGNLMNNFRINFSDVWLEQVLLEMKAFTLIIIYYVAFVAKFPKMWRFKSYIIILLMMLICVPIFIWRKFDLMNVHIPLLASYNPKYETFFRWWSYLKIYVHFAYDSLEMDIQKRDLAVFNIVKLHCTCLLVLFNL